MTGARPAVRWLAVIFWAGLIFAFSSQSHLPYPHRFSVASVSTVGHAFVYFTLSALLYWAFRGHGAEPVVAAILAATCAFVYGLSDEWHQSFVPGRDSSLADAGVDLIAASVAALVVVVIARVRRSAGPA
jgi:VanZ family protein